MAPKFGTSGLRGLVTELTPELVQDYVSAFADTVDVGDRVYVAEDLRPSSGTIADAVVAAIAAGGRTAIRAGRVPTPALALAAQQAGAAAVMVTGSHIPADRNGLKFYRAGGDEIDKADEAAIVAALGRPARSGQGRVEVDPGCGARYLDRYRAAFGPDALAGLKIGVWQHSTVARDLLADLLAALGARVLPLDRSETFVPVDTEAVDPATRARLAGWAADHAVDALVSADGDADRPLLTDATGRMVLGDVLGPLTARLLGADTIVTPVSSNSLVEAMGAFARVIRTRIGSPYVIGGMAAAPPGSRVVGYEANGGFLLGFAARGPAGPLAPLLTRDAVLPMLAPLVAARAAGQGLADLVAALPARFTAADRIAGIATPASLSLLAHLRSDANARAAFFAACDPGLGTETSLDMTDGLRAGFASTEVIHLRPSGNAPEFRCYAEAASAGRADALVRHTLAALRQRLDPQTSQADFT
jgi:phosphomannomutase